MVLPLPLARDVIVPAHRAFRAALPALPGPTLRAPDAVGNHDAIKAGALPHQKEVAAPSELRAASTRRGRPQRAQDTFAA